MKTLALNSAFVAVLLLGAAALPASAAPRRAAAAAPASTAAAAPAAPAGPPVNWGPPLAGVCIFSFDRAIGPSLAGKAAAARMQQLRAQVAAELQGEQTSIQTDGAALNARKATLSADQFQQQAIPINQRIEALNRKAQVRERELEATGQKALQRIQVSVEPLVRAAASQRQCSLLLGGESTLGSNPAMDLTPGVSQQLDTRLPTITFDREILPQQ